MIQTSPVTLTDIEDMIHSYLTNLTSGEDPQNSVISLLKTFLENITTELKQGLFELIKEIQGSIRRIIL